MISLIPTGDPNPKSKRLTYDQIKEWNSFMDKNNDGSDIFNLYQRYRKLNPKGNIDYNALQNEMNLLVSNSKRLTNTRNEYYKDNNRNTDNRFPMMTRYGQGELGVVNGDLKTEGSQPMAGLPKYMIKNEVPDYVDKLEWHPSYNQPYYKEGDEIVFVDRKFYNSDRFLKPQGLSSGLIALK